MSIEAFPIVAYWHATKPVYSVTFESNSITRFATCGGDSKVKIWGFRKDENSNSDQNNNNNAPKTFTQLAQESVTKIEFLSSLVGFEKTVNVGRFSHSSDVNNNNNSNKATINNENVLACAGDDGMIMLWKRETEEDIKNGIKHSTMMNMMISTQDEFDDSSENKENWYIWKKLRSTNTSEIYDLNWSPDNEYIVAGCLDYSIKVFQVKTEKCLYHSTTDKGHSNYVQGVEWDPLNEMILTLGADRAMCVYEIQWNNKSGVLQNLKLINKIIKGDIQGKSNYLFKNVDTSFFRRLKFSPCGSILLAPAGIWKPQVGTTTATTNNNNNNNNNGKENEAANEVGTNCVHIFSRANLLDKSNKPIGTIPNLSSRAVAVSFNPNFYKLSNPSTSILQIPYKLIFAIATLDQVLIYDTETLNCITVVRNLHYSSIHDLNWNSDGSKILVSSNDGFVSTIDLVNYKSQFGELIADKSEYIKPYFPSTSATSRSSVGKEETPTATETPVVNVLVPRKKA